MARMLTLAVEKRDAKIKLAQLIASGKIPAVFYGPKEETTSISMSLSDFTKTWKKAGESSVIILKEGSSEHEALIHEVDVHPVTDVPRHADFYVIEKGKKIKVHVQLSFTGTSPAVKELGAILVKVLREVEVEAGAKDLPHELVVDISALVDLKSVIHIKDIPAPTGVTILGNPEDVVASISEAKEEVEEVVPIDMSTIEVAAKGKEAKEGAEGEAAADGAADAKGGGGKKEEKK